MAVARSSNSADDSIRYLAGAAELADVAPCPQPGAESDPRADDSHSADLCSAVPQAATAVLARAPAAAEADDPRDSAPAVPSRHELQQRSAPLRQSASPPSTRIGIAWSFHFELAGTATTGAVSITSPRGSTLHLLVVVVRRIRGRFHWWRQFLQRLKICQRVVIFHHREILLYSGFNLLHRNWQRRRRLRAISNPQHRQQ